MTEAIRILFVSSEVHPLVKTGGLGDVSGTLPPALRSQGADVRILLPAYPGTLERTAAEPVGAPFPVLPGLAPVRLMAGTMPDGKTPVYLIDAPGLYARDGGPYVAPDGQDWPDNAERFALLSRVAALFGCGEGLAGWAPDIVHCNDWQTGLAPAYLAHAPDARAKSLISVHNLAFQGNFSPYLMPNLGLPWSSFSADGVEFFGNLSFLKAGLFYADHINTVSPTYAREIQTAEFAYGMEGLLATRKTHLTGILNGVDTLHWDPDTDRHIPHRYNSKGLAGKAADKQTLQERLGLNPAPEVPLLGMVTRLTWQKGIDLVLGICDDLLKEDVQLAVLGSGDPVYGKRLQALQAQHPGQVGLTFGYDEDLAHLIEAGSDAFLMPSRFEPCGLTQMYSMRYGSLPVVRRVGGLAASVVDATARTIDAGEATGFVFRGANENELLACVQRALLLYRNKKAWRQVQVTGMRQDFSWEHSAGEYLKLYRKILAA